MRIAGVGPKPTSAVIYVPRHEILSIPLLFIELLKSLQIIYRRNISLNGILRDLPVADVQAHARFGKDGLRVAH